MPLLASEVMTPPPAPGHRSSPRWLAATRVAAAGVAGVLVWLSFPPAGQWWTAPIGVAVLALAVAGASKRVAAGAGFVHGTVLFVLLMSFVRIFGVDAWLVLAAGEGLFFVALALLLRLVSRLRWWPLAVGCAWVAEEALRDRFPFGGFPWGRLADAQAGGPVAHLAALGGAPLVTFAVALAGGLLAAAVADRQVRALAAAVGVVSVGWAVQLPTAGTTTGGPSSVQVALVQGNVPRLGLTAFAQRYAVTRNQERETILLAQRVKAGAAARPQFVVWPENSADNDPFVDPLTRAIITRAVQRIGVPVLVGAILNDGADHLRNAGIVWSPITGPGEMYVKRHLLPFGEYLPFRPELSHWIERFSLLPKDFSPGTKPGVLHIGPTTIADAICFEIADDENVRQDVTGGGRLIVNQTNDASYEQPGDSPDSGESAQQLQISRLRAIEHGRTVLVTSTSGVSAVISPDGRLESESGIFTPAILDATVALRDPLTLADRVGAWPEWVLTALGVAAGVWAWWLGRRSGRRAGETDAGTSSTGPDGAPTPVTAKVTGP